MARTPAKTSDTGANLGFEAKLWVAADALRNNMDAAEYGAGAGRSALRNVGRLMRQCIGDEVMKVFRVD